MKYCKIDDAKAAFSSITQKKLNSSDQPIQVSYLCEDSSSLVLSSIHESVDSDKSDQEAYDNNAPQEEIKEELKVDEDSRPFTPFKPRQRIMQITPPRKDLNMTVCYDRKDSYVKKYLRSYYLTPHNYHSSHFNTPNSSAIHTETTTNLDSDEGHSNGSKTELRTSLYLL